MKALCPSITTDFYRGSGSVRISIIGSTGSIGTQAVSLVERFPGRFTVVGLAAGKNIKLLASQIAICKPAVVCVSEEKDIRTLRAIISHPCEIVFGDSGLQLVSALENSERVLVAASGSAGIIPTIAALTAGKTVALANKECVVAVPHLLEQAITNGGGKLIPVDSEHSALFQLLLDRPSEEISNVTITASGGPFRGYTKDRLSTVTLEQALKHPRWSMGAKITVDSATMMNKAFELIEAVRLFGLPQEKVKVVVHPQSIVHGAVTFTDGSIVLHASATDMSGPIAFGLTFPDARLQKAVLPLNLAEQGKFEFLELDNDVFPAVSLARHCVAEDSMATAVMHVANECLVDRFLAGSVVFADMYPRIEDCVTRFSKAGSISSIDDFLALYAEVKGFVNL